jgi:hypothetical protein
MMPGKKKKEKKKCSYEIEFPDYKCSREALPGDEHCIFHSKDIEGKKDKFNDAFWKEFERQKEHEEIYDFTGFVFPVVISFKEKTFEKDAYFSSTKFSAVADFSVSQFSGEADFVYAKFSKGANFGDAHFSVADFMEVKFFEEAYFSGTQFAGITFFKDAQFHGLAIFSLTKFIGVTSFWSARFSAEADFSNAKFKGDADFNYIKIEKYNRFSNVSGLFEAIDANKKKFKYSNKTEFLPDNFYLILGEEATARYPIISRKIKDDMYLLRFKKKHPNIHFIWWTFADCGRSFLRWALWSFIFAEIFAIVFGLFYYFNPASIKSEVISFSWPGISLLYYSVVTFTTLGFGDIVPKIPILQIIVMLEVILGYIMLGGLISILANKLARRS